ncbi:MAG: UDP-N-acetylmuramoyl-L-alanyl-D-glutamate--2,6-diaminopimelate ligase [Chlorobi bacterium]|nr:UDP-N-acetylmuramoyl-L-alanyl-D-glutamate--2,6-diaminopimelate ligase [Chlorobiota bacterium]
MPNVIDLQTILAPVEGLRELRGDRTLPVTGIRHDSRTVAAGDMYVAINGRDDQGLRYVPEAIAAGAKIIVTDAPDALPIEVRSNESITLVVVDDARAAMGEMANRLHNYPAHRMKVFGITGTNGKTTTAWLLLQLLEAAGERVGMIGTLGKYLHGTFTPTGYTTPESPELVALLAEMADANCTAVVMEVSSHALALHRVGGVRFHAAIFTNLTQDHLDFHGSMAEYHDAKKRLFDHLDADRSAVVNLDDLHGTTMVRDSYANVVAYGAKEEADAHIAETELGADHTAWTLKLSEQLGGDTLRLRSPLVGAFNIWNATAAVATALTEGMEKALLVQTVRQLRPVPGRMETIPLPNGAVAVVDYAHTPDALAKALSTLRQISGTGTLTVVFGCGGDRDRTKRPIMGQLAARLADRVILTSDNPRSEDPEAILDQIAAGIAPDAPAAAAVVRISDRATAIRTALSGAHAGDVLLVAGKGHEDYQIIGTQKTYFDDGEVVRNWAAAQSAAQLQQPQELAS